MTNATAAALDVPLLDGERRQPPALPPPRGSGPKRGSSSSCFLADGILADGEDGACAKPIPTQNIPASATADRRAKVWDMVC